MMQVPVFKDSDSDDAASPACNDLPEENRETHHRRRNRPTLYIPGFSEKDSHIEIRRRNTPDGPLIIGEEVSSQRYRRGLFSRDDIDSGLESSFSVLSVTDESGLREQEGSRPSVGLNTAQVPIYSPPEDGCENEISNSSMETASFLEESSKLLEYFSDDFDQLPDSSLESPERMCCHGNIITSCDNCLSISSDSRKSIGLNTACQSFREVDQCTADTQTDITSPPIGNTKYVHLPVHKEVLSFPFPNIVNVPGSSPALQNKTKVILSTHPKPAFEQSFVSTAEILSGKSSAFSSFKSPAKYCPQNVMSPSIQTTIIVGGEERMCIATQTGHQGDGDSTLIQYLPSLDGRMPGSPSKERVLKSNYLSPLSLDNRTAGELWEDIVHSSDRKHRDAALVNKVFTTSCSQTETVNELLSTSTDEESLVELSLYENATGGAGDKPSRTTYKKRTGKIITESATSGSAQLSVPLGRKIVGGCQKPLGRLFSELPVSSQTNLSTANCSPSQSTSQYASGHTALTSTPVQDRKRVRSQVAPPVQPESKPRGRAIRKGGASLQLRKAKVRAIRPRQSLSDGETDQNTPPVSMEMSPCQHQTKTVSYHDNLSNTSIDVRLDIKTSTPVKKTGCRNQEERKMEDNSFSSGDEDFQQSSAQNELPSEVLQTPSYFSPLMSSTSDEINQSDLEMQGRRLRPMKTFQDRVEVSSPSTPPPTIHPGFKMNINTDIELSPSELDTITKIHTICNGQRLVEYLNCSDSPMILTHYPPPREASKIQWHSELEKEVDDPTLVSPVSPSPPTPKPILTQRPENFKFPYSGEAPSPILLTKTRRQNLLSQITQHTQL